MMLLDEPFRSQEQNPRVDATEDEMEPLSLAKMMTDFEINSLRTGL
jgi:hypothetical protein